MGVCEVMDNMDWLMLKTLAVTKNLTTAAEKLFITQPALTYRIKNIEEEMKTTILVRHSKGIYFTDQGLLLIKYAEEMLKQYDKLKDDLYAMSPEVRGLVHVAVSSAFSHSPLADALSAFCEAYPLVSVYVNAHMSSTAVKQLLNDEVQVAIIRGNHNLKCRADFLGSKPINVISKREIELSALPKLPYIKYATDGTLEHDVAEWWSPHYDMPPRTIMSLNDSFACRRMVDRGMGFTILPSLVSEKDNMFKLVERPLVKKNGEILQRPAWIAYKDYALKIRAVTIFIDFMKKKLTSM